MKEMELKDYKLFIYDDVNFNTSKSSVRSEYWEQIENNEKWIPITYKMYDNIHQCEWLNDLIDLELDIDPVHFVMKELQLSERHKISLIRLEDFMSNYFINFELELKERQDRPLKIFLYTDFENGEVFIIKYIK